MLSPRIALFSCARHPARVFSLPYSSAPKNPKNAPIKVVGSLQKKPKNAPIKAVDSLQENPENAPIEVVGSFLFKKINDGESPQVALFKRSPSVDPYPNKWGIISGRVEPHDNSLRKAALRELQEETDLRSWQLAIIRRGRPYVLTDKDAEARSWSINPFSFTLHGERKLILQNKEHVEWRWFNPDDVLKGAKIKDTDGEGESEMVPGLGRSLKSVWLEGMLGRKMASVLTKGVSDLSIASRIDHLANGPCQRVALGIFKEVVRGLDFSNKEVWAEGVSETSWHLVKALGRRKCVIGRVQRMEQNLLLMGKKNDVSGIREATLPGVWDGFKAPVEKKSEGVSGEQTSKGVVVQSGKARIKKAQNKIKGAQSGVAQSKKVQKKGK